MEYNGYKISEFKLILLILRIRGNLPYQQTTNYYLLFYRARYPTEAISLSHVEISKQWREVENCKLMQHGKSGLDHRDFFVNLTKVGREHSK